VLLAVIITGIQIIRSFTLFGASYKHSIEAGAFFSIFLIPPFTLYIIRASDLIATSSDKWRDTLLISLLYCYSIIIQIGFFGSQVLNGARVLDFQTNYLLACAFKQHGPYVYFRDFEEIWLSIYKSGVRDYPPLLHMLYALPFYLFGESERTFVLIATLMSNLAVIPIYYIAKVLFDRKVAVFASLFFLTSPIKILHLPSNHWAGAFFFGISILYFIKSYRTRRTLTAITTGILFSFSVLVKLTGLLLFFPVFPLLFLNYYSEERKRETALLALNIGLSCLILPLCLYLVTGYNLANNIIFGMLDYRAWLIPKGKLTSTNPIISTFYNLRKISPGFQFAGYAIFLLFMLSTLKEIITRKSRTKLVLISACWGSALLLISLFGSLRIIHTGPLFLLYILSASELLNRSIRDISRSKSACIIIMMCNYIQAFFRFYIQ